MQRTQRLHEALHNIRGNAAMMEDLLAGLSEAQSLLITKEKDPLPEDLHVITELVHEHLNFHEDLSQKKKDVDRLTKLASSTSEDSTRRRKSLSGRYDQGHLHNSHI